jgi:hypothetical protein
VEGEGDVVKGVFVLLFAKLLEVQEEVLLVSE